MSIALAQQQRGLERPAPRSGQLGKHIRDAVLEQVDERRVREPLLRLRGPRREHLQRPLARRLDAGEPERRLADPRLAFEHDDVRPPACPGDECLERGDLVVPPDDLDCHRRRW